MAEAIDLNISKAYFIDSVLFYPFGDGQVVKRFYFPTLLATTSRESGLSISSECRLGKHLIGIAEEFACVGLECEGRIHLPNPNFLYSTKKYTFASNFVIFYEGILKKEDDLHFLYKIIE